MRRLTRKWTGLIPVGVSDDAQGRARPPQARCRRHQCRIRRSGDPRHPRGHRRRGTRSRSSRNLDADLARRDPKPFLGTSDNTNLHHWLWGERPSASFYGGSSQVHLGPGGPGVDDVSNARSLRAAPCHRRDPSKITDPGESEDFGVDWGDPPRPLDSFGDREPTEPWRLARPGTVSYRSHLGAVASRPSNGSSPRGDSRSARDVPRMAACSSSRTSEELLPGAQRWAGIVRSLGRSAASSRRSERRVLVARPPGV